MSETTIVKTKKPDWLKVKLPTGEDYKKVRNLVSEISFIPYVKVEIVQIWTNVGELELQLL